MIAGVFFIFSVAIMRALERVPNGAVAMQSINVVILNPMFLGVFMGTAVLCIVLAIGSIMQWPAPRSGWCLAGSILYLTGGVGVTIVFNVPMNNALVAADTASAAGDELWKNYLTNWTRWNHVRTVASLAAAATLTTGLTYLR